MRSVNMKRPFQVGQTVWWLNNCFWRVQESRIINHRSDAWNGAYWEISPDSGLKVSNGAHIVVHECELFTDKCDAYKEGIAQLNESVDVFTSRRDEALLAQQNLIDAARCTGLIYLSQSDIDSLLVQLIWRIQRGGRDFSRVVGIANGGLPISKVIAEELKLPHTSVRVSHYDGRILREAPIVEGCLPEPTNNLIVDDLIDRGRTYNTFTEHFGMEGNAMAVLFWNPVGPEPDYYVREKPDAWIIFPWEAKCSVC
jgi:hypoxanthine phosphoribosyltransferase